MRLCALLRLEMPITRMGNEVNAQRVKNGDEDERAGEGGGSEGV